MNTGAFFLFLRDWLKSLSNRARTTDQITSQKLLQIRLLRIDKQFICRAGGRQPSLMEEQQMCIRDRYSVD